MRTKVSQKISSRPDPVPHRPFRDHWKGSLWIFLSSAAFAVIFNSFYNDGIELKVGLKKRYALASNQSPVDYPGFRKPIAKPSAQPTHRAAPVANDSIPRLSLQGAFSRFQKGTAVFLDARKPEEYQEGHIPGALNFYGNELDRFAPLVIPQLTDKNQEIVAYCHGGDCDLSLQVGKTLKEQGYTQVKIFQDGWPAWSKAGYPTKAGEKP